ncbi:MAG: 4-hydroxy-tetrahydrodipicolinate reductase [Actinomycetota bacterium]
MTARLDVAVVGADGRMGRQVCAAVSAAPEMDLVGQFDHGDELGDLAGASVVIDFTIPSVTQVVVRHCVQQGIHVVVGATGWDAARLAELADRLDSYPGVGVLIAPNFSIGAVLAMRFAQQAARFYESVEVVELHHPDKVDAPSGTALRTASLIGQARQQAGLGPIPDATTSDPSGSRGADVDGVRVHAVRLRGLVAHEEILFGAPGEQLTIRHDSFDRESFMPGVLAGVRAISSRPGLTVGLEHILDLG